MALIEDQTHKIMAKALNGALEDELSEALGREPHERCTDGRLRNGSKAVSVPGFFGRLWLRKPVLRTATPASPLLASLRRSGKELVNKQRNARTRVAAKDRKAFTRDFVSVF